MGRITCLSTIVWAACSVGDSAAPEDPGDLALDWEADPELEPSTPICPEAQPDCDRLDEPDTGDELVGDLGDTLDDGGTERTTDRALADPLVDGHYRSWPNGRIPYKFATTNGVYQLNAATRATVSQAMTNWSTLTEDRVRFRAKTSSDTAYVIIKLGSPRVGPFVGYRAGRVQELYLRQNEYITVAKHELGHVLGLHHEQRRTDRLSYIQVRTGNIVNTTTCQYQFSTCSTCKRVGSYNRGSVMHYRTTDLAGCRTGPVLLKLDGSAISHYWQVTTLDRNAIATMYPTSFTSLSAGGGIRLGDTCLDGAGTSACSGTGSQSWRTTRRGQLRVKDTLHCAAVAGDAAPGATIEQVACSDAANQKWTFDAMELVNGTACVSVASTGAVGVEPCDGSPTQKLAYRAESETLETPGGGGCLTAGTDSTIELAACDGRATQRWFQGRGGFVSRSDIGACLAPSGTGLVLAPCTDDASQQWALRGPIRDARAGLCLAGDTLAECANTPHAWTFASR